MKSRPILFSGPMVRTLLAGTKTQTRRVVKPQPIDGSALFTMIPQPAYGGTGAVFRGPEGVDARPKEHQRPGSFSCPYGQPGDRLWVKETHLPKASGIIYRADFSEFEAAGLGGMYGGWKPSIFCRREYSRITLEITTVRVERLQDISEADCYAEGIQRCAFIGRVTDEDMEYVARCDYRDLWASINGRGSWDANPWVWVIEFWRLEP